MHKVMCNTISYKGNENQNYTEIPSHPSENDCHQENKQQMLARMLGAKEPSYTVDRNII
jgi:hypothetical protein